jgi:hypothetical protein
MIEIKTTLLMITRSIDSVKLLVDQDFQVKKTEQMKYIAACFSRVILKIRGYGGQTDTQAPGCW